MSKIIKFRLDHCDRCKHSDIKPIYTPDSFDSACSIYCELSKRQVVDYVYSEDVKDVKIPEWCKLENYTETIN